MGALKEWEVVALRALDSGPLGPEELARAVFGGADGTIVYEVGLRSRASARWTRLVGLGLVEVRGSRLAVTGMGQAAAGTWRLDGPTDVDFVTEFHRAGFSVLEASRRCRVTTKTVRAWLEGRLPVAPDAGMRLVMPPWPDVVAVPSWALPGGRRGAR